LNTHILAIIANSPKSWTPAILSIVFAANQIIEKRTAIIFTSPKWMSSIAILPRIVLAQCRVFAEGFANMRQRKTLRERIERRIVRRRDEDVFLTREFSDLGGEDQVLRALRSLVRDKRLVRLGYGVYGRAIVSRLSGEPLLYSANGFIGAARQALTKLGVPWEPTEAERAYNERRSTQVPVNPVVRIKGRFSRRLHDGNLELVLER
jgi:hypothetical protein